MKTAADKETLYNVKFQVLSQVYILQNKKLVTTEVKYEGLHEKHVVANWNLGNHLIICFLTQGNQEKPVSKWPVAEPSEY